MNKKKIILSLVGLLVVSGVGGGLALNSWLSRLLTKESLVRQLESQWNCRVDMSDLKVSLYSTPAHVEVKHMVLATRDADATAATPLEKRKPVAQGTSIVVAEEVLLEVDLTDLLHRRLHVKRLSLKGVAVRNDVSEEQGNLLQKMFSKPVSTAPVPPVQAPAAPEPAATTVSAPTTAEPTPKKEVKRPVFQADQLGMSVMIDEARLEQGSFRELNHLVSTVTEISNLDLAITQVDVDPGDLEHHDQCMLHLSARARSEGRAKIAGTMQDVKVADFTFDAGGTVQPLDPATGALSVVGKIDLLLKKDSILGGTRTLDEVGGGALKSMKNYGIDATKVKVGGQLLQDTQIQAVLNGTRVEFPKEATFLFPDYAVTLRAGGWLNATDDKQEMQLLVVPSEAMATTLKEGAKAKLGEGAVSLVQSMFNDGQGHLAFDLVFSGSLSKPKVEPGGAAGALKNLFKGLLK